MNLSEDHLLVAYTTAIVSSLAALGPLERQIFLDEFETTVQTVIASAGIGSDPEVLDALVVLRFALEDGTRDLLYGQPP